MNTAMPQKDLEKLFDQALREVTEAASGIQLRQDPLPPKEDALCTVHIDFQKGFHSSLSVCVDLPLLARMARNMLQTDQLTVQDLEDFGKEYINILCGQISAVLFQTTRIASRFGVPTFHRGRFQPENQSQQFALNYFSDRQEGAQLIHHIPEHG